MLAISMQRQTQARSGIFPFTHDLLVCGLMLETQRPMVFPSWDMWLKCKTLMVVQLPISCQTRTKILAKPNLTHPA